MARAPRPRLIGSLVALLVWLLPHGALESAERRWYVVEIQGKRAGWMTIEHARIDGRQITAQKTQLKIGRGRVDVEIEIAAQFVETDDGRPISMSSYQAMGAFPLAAEYTFQPSGIEVTRRQGGEERTETLPHPEGAWLPPAAADRYFQEQMRQGADEVVIRTLDPTLGVTAVTQRRRLQERTASRTRWESTIDALPGVTSYETYDGEGRLVEIEMTMMGIPIRMVQASRDVAEGPIDAPEILVATLLRPRSPIPEPRATRHLQLRLTRQGELPPDLPTVAGQIVTREKGARLVDISTARAHRALPEEKAAVFLQASSFLDHEHPKIRELVAQATADVGAEPPERAEAMRRFVHRYVREKSLDTAFATATEVALQATGDCSEHGVLLAAMLRADGIPSRVVTGLMYVDRFVGQSRIFGYHMWTQALIDGRWIDYDAVLRSRRFDAAHIVITTSALNDDAPFMAELASLSSQLEGLEIEVVKVSHDPVRRRF